jgi:glutamine cyclotransferase
MRKAQAHILREYGPFPGVEQVHGVTYDGENLWFAAGDTINAVDPESGELVRSIDVASHAGTAFDGRHLYQIAEDRILRIEPSSGKILASIPAPGNGGDSGLTWAEGSLWVGHYRSRQIHQVDPETGAVLETISMPEGTGVSGLESDGAGRFFCGGGRSGTIRAVSRPR